MHGEQRHQQVQRPRHGHRDQPLGPGPGRGEPPRHSAGPIVQLRIAERGRAECRRGRVRCLAHPSREQLRQRGGRGWPGRRVSAGGGGAVGLGGAGRPGGPGGHRPARLLVPGGQHLVPFVLREQRGAADPLPGVGDQRAQQPLPPRHQRRDGAAVEQVRGVLEVPGQAAGRAVGPVPHGEGEGQVHLGRADRQLGGLRGQAGQVEGAGRAAVVQREHDLEQRVVRQRPVRVDCLDHPLERHVLVAERRQVGLPDALQQVTERGVAGGVGAQHHGVDEAADQVLQRLVGAAGDGGADGEVAARAEPGEQHRERGVQHHEHGAAGLPGQVRDGGVQAGVDGRLDVLAPAAGGGPPRPVQRQRDQLGQPGQLVAPVPELDGQQAARLVGAAEDLPLPVHVVAVVGGQRRVSLARGPAGGRRRRRTGPGRSGPATSRRRRCGAPR